MASLVLLVLLISIVYISALNSYLLPQKVFACPGSESHAIITDNTSQTENNTSSSGSGGFNTFQNSTLGIKLEYPSDWRYHLYNVSVDFTPMVTGQPLFDQALKISVGNNYSIYTLEPYETVDKHFLKNGTKFTITPLLVDGQPAIKNEFTVFRIQQIPCPPPFPEPNKIVDIYVPHGDKVYTIEYMENSDGQNLALTAQKMIDSLQIEP